MKPFLCHQECSHNIHEHRAFDRGVADGRAGKQQDENPYKYPNLAEAWWSGHSVGRLEYLEYLLRPTTPE